MTLKTWLPSLSTFANLFLGFIALTMVNAGNTRIALTLIILALFFDGIDGRIARKLNVSSIFGKELDSLSDNFTFGAVPAFFFVVTYGELSVLNYVLALIFLGCGTYQVAKYNTDFLYGSAKSELPGLPINVAGIIIALFGYLNPFIFIIDALIILILSVLTATEIPYPSFKGYRPATSLHLLIPIGILLVFVTVPTVTFIVLNLYAVYGVLNLYIDFDKLIPSSS